MLAPLEGQPELLRLIRERLEQVPLSTDDLYAVIDPLQDAPDEYVGEWWLDASRCRFWLCLHVDWKAYDEVGWQIQAISRTLGLEPGFASTAEEQWDAYFEHLRSGHPENGRSQVPGADLGTPACRPSVTQRLRTGLNTVRQAIRRSSPARLLGSVQPPSASAPTLDVLEDGVDWLRERGYELLFLETGGDDYLAVPVQLGRLTQARAVAGQLNVSTFIV